MGKRKTRIKDEKQQQRAGIQFLADQCNFRGLALVAALDRLDCTLYVSDGDAAKYAGWKMDIQKTADGHALRVVKPEPETAAEAPITDNDA